MNQRFSQRLDAFAPHAASCLRPIRRGIEKESLRIQSSGRLSAAAHYPALGSALTHKSITMDFAEQLLEFVTPVSDDIDQTLAYLADSHKFVLSNIEGESLWPMSMPCFIRDEQDIKIAQFGSSNVGRMKSIYREGLRRRYGAMMQVIAGIHYNFSLPDAFWPVYAELNGVAADDDALRSNGYMALIRNYYRYAWLIPYLFGASPAICDSFLQGRTPDLPLEKVAKGTLVLPYGTSLRLSDLGYTNKAQQGLYICHNSLENYLSGLQKAISTPSADYAQIGVKVDGQYRQLNDRVLQIENELYAPIRPKRVTQRGETPSQALHRGGVEYVEVRSLDVNPFNPVGIDRNTIAFLDLLLLYCAINDSPLWQDGECQQAKQNFKDVVLRGRDPQLTLNNGEQSISLRDWASAICEQLAPLAELLDQNDRKRTYSNTLRHQRRKILNSELTPSGQVLARLLSAQQDNNVFGLSQAQQFQRLLVDVPYQITDEAYWQDLAASSVAEQQALERDDGIDLDTYIKQYTESSLT